jgi:hypothetical protein
VALVFGPFVLGICIAYLPSLLFLLHPLPPIYIFLKHNKIHHILPASLWYRKKLFKTIFVLAWVCGDSPTFLWNVFICSCFSEYPLFLKSPPLLSFSFSFSFLFFDPNSADLLAIIATLANDHIRTTVWLVARLFCSFIFICCCPFFYYRKTNDANCTLIYYLSSQTKVI